MDRSFYQIDEVAVRTGLTKRALRYYEDMELINPVRTEAGYRLYSEEDIEKVRRIREIKDSLGFSLSDIKSVLDLEKDLNDILKGTPHDRDYLDRCVADVQQKIKLIEEKERTLERVKAKYNEVLAKLGGIIGGGSEK